MNPHTVKVVPGPGLTTQGTEVWVDGKKLQGVTRIALEAQLNDVWRVEIGQIVLVTDMEVDTTDLSMDVRTLRSVSRWTLLKALFSPRLKTGGDVE